MVFFNHVRYSGELFTSLRIIRRMLLERIDFHDLAPSVQLQKGVFIVARELGKMAKLLLTVRTDASAEFGDYSDYNY